VGDLLVTVHTPALGSGRSLRTYGVVRALAAETEIDILHPVFGAPEPDAAFASIPRVRFHPVIPSRGAARARAYARARFGGVPPALARAASPELVDAAERLASQARRVIADGAATAGALQGLARRREVIYNAHNLESAFRHTLGAGGLGSQRRLARFERCLLERFAETWMVSGADMKAARQLCPDARLRYVPNVVDVAAIRPMRPVPGGPALLVADFTYEPNRNGLQFLLGEVMPRVWARQVDARLLLVGRGLDGNAGGDARVEALGFVADLREAYARAACALVPLLEGGGSPLKFVEALAYGLPVVATPKAAAGLEVNANEHFLLGDGPEGFARALLAALAGGVEEIGRAGRALAEQRYSLATLARLVAP
jgi:glycosyltransferase involved in cell wall biosynthesis